MKLVAFISSNLLFNTMKLITNVSSPCSDLVDGALISLSLNVLIDLELGHPIPYTSLDMLTADLTTDLKF
jgi:hypothetical protein